MKFTDLHLPENINAARKALRGKIGIYAIVCLPLLQEPFILVHLWIYGIEYMKKTSYPLECNTNAHLQNALKYYGLENFAVCIIEFLQDQCALLVLKESNIGLILFSHFCQSLPYLCTRTRNGSLNFPYIFTLTL